MREEKRRWGVRYVLLKTTVLVRRVPDPMWGDPGTNNGVLPFDELERICDLGTTTANPWEYPYPTSRSKTVEVPW